MSVLQDCAAVPDHIELGCNEFKKGGISGIAIMKCDHTITDFTSVSQWNSNIASGHVKMIKNIKATIGEASPIEGENPVPCGSENILDLLDQTITWKDFNVHSLNDDFYQQLNLAKRSIAWFYCEEDEIRVVDECNVTFVALPPSSPESNREKQFYNVKGSWTSLPNEFPVLYTAPAGVFTV